MREFKQNNSLQSRIQKKYKIFHNYKKNTSIKPAK